MWASGSFHQMVWVGDDAGWGRLKDSDGEKKGKREKSKEETEKGDLLCSCMLLLLAFFK